MLSTLSFLRKFAGAAVLSTVAIGSLAACQTAGVHSLGQVHTGMYKAGVIDAAGSPNFIQRVNGQDYWIYETHDHSDDYIEREVHFLGGRVVYVGPHQAPASTAEERDRKNEEHNAAAEVREDQEQQDHDQRLGISRSHIQEDRDDRRLRESMYGLEPNQQDQRKTVAPVFEPVQ